jgi:uncharacterized protein YjbJ (UPF0337 family)
MEEDQIMSNAGKRVEGKAEEIVGKVKGAVGNLIGNDRMEAEGKATALKGELKQEVAKGAERIKGAVEQVAGKAKQVVGSLVDSEQMELEGKATELKGEARRAGNR